MQDTMDNYYPSVMHDTACNVIGEDDRCIITQIGQHAMKTTKEEQA
jgi:hypothetical protein